jgi:GNAT superfamily N-acetyltransferase
MLIKPIDQRSIPDVIKLMDLGAPYIRSRSYSDYWLYSQLFSSTCPVAVEGDLLVGAVMAFRSQEDPDDIYIQDVMVHPEFRQRGVARSLVDSVRNRAVAWGCRRMYLTSEPDNAAAHSSWHALGFSNMQGDRVIDGVSVFTDFKGPGKTRAVYEMHLR